MMQTGPRPRDPGDSAAWGLKDRWEKAGWNAGRRPIAAGVSSERNGGADEI